MQSICHNLRTPLNHSIYYGEQIEDKCESNEIKENLVHPLLSSNELMKATLNDLEDFYSISQNEF